MGESSSRYECVKNFGGDWFRDGNSRRKWTPHVRYNPLEESPYEWIEEHFPVRRNCTFCQKRLKVFNVCPEILHQDPEQDGPFWPEPEDAEWAPDHVHRALSGWFDCLYRMWVCGTCGFWQWFALEQYRQNLTATLATSIARSFEPELPEGCLAELSQALVRSPRKLDLIDPTKMEHLVADVFRANYRHSRVVRVGGPGDGGVDVLMVDDCERTWAIQVKRRAKRGTEGVATIRHLLGTMLVQGIPNGMVVSTADHFSHLAHDEARIATSRRSSIERVQLVDRAALMKFLGCSAPLDGVLKPLTEGKLCIDSNCLALREYFSTALRALRPSYPTSAGAFQQLELFSTPSRTQGSALYNNGELDSTVMF